jgi:hypothetical protein
MPKKPLLDVRKSHSNNDAHINKRSLKLRRKIKAVEEKLSANCQLAELRTGKDQ